MHLLVRVVERLGRVLRAVERFETFDLKISDEALPSGRPFRPPLRGFPVSLARVLIEQEHASGLALERLRDRRPRGRDGALRRLGRRHRRRSSPRSRRWGATPAAILRTHSHTDHVVARGRAARALRHRGRRRARRAGSGAASGFAGLRDAGALRRHGRLRRRRRGRLHRRHPVQGRRRRRRPRPGAGLRDGRVHGASRTRRACCPATPTRRRSAASARENPFVRVWSGAEPEGTERVEVGGREATLVVWSPDYDGKGKAWVRFDDGEDAIVGGSAQSQQARQASVPRRG